MTAPYKQINVGNCKLYNHPTNRRRAILLLGLVKKLGLNVDDIIFAKKDRLGKFISKFGGKLLEYDRKHDTEESWFAEGFGKAFGELFCEAYINCGRYDRFTGISNYIPGFILGHPDHGVEGKVTIKFKEYETGTLQCKMTLNHYGPNTAIERNTHKCGNFYQQSVEDYGMDDLPLKTRKKYMVYFGNYETNNRNCDGFNFVLRDQLNLVNVEKEFWQEFFDCLQKLAETDVKQRSNNVLHLYPSQQQDVSQLVNVAGQDNSSCGGGKSVKMHYLQQEDLCK
jgi:hypothetical protein